MLFRSAIFLGVLTALTACQPQATTSPTTITSTPIINKTQEFITEKGRLQVTTITEGLENPWAIALLPEGGILVTERPGRLRRVSADGTLSEPLSGVPTVFSEGQGGLLDVALSPDFEQSKRIYFSYAEPGENNTNGTAVASATLGETGLTDVKVIYQQQPKLNSKVHFGSRLAFDHQGHIFISQGERNERLLAQDLNKLQGKLVRLNLDGTIPNDNPFVGRNDARPEIWSYGHRNMQGLAFDPRTGTLWQTEHGPRGGDEINLPQPGKNYGWPLITYGINYSGDPIPEAVGKEKEGLEQPWHYFEVSPALSGMAFFTGQENSAWNNSLFLGSLVQRSLIRLQLDGDKVVSEERLLGDLGQRVRDVRVAKDGSIYVVFDEKESKIIKLNLIGK